MADCAGGVVCACDGPVAGRVVCACEGLPGEDGADWFAAEFDGSLRMEESADGARWVDEALVELVGEFVWVWAEVGELVEPLGDCAKAAVPKMRPTAVLNNNCLFFRCVGLATPK